MGFFENYFHLNQQMPTTSGFRGDFFSSPAAKRGPKMS
jgi:hypothetical protein